MPIYPLQCPDCEHRFSGMVFAGTRAPALWVCPQCGSEQAKLNDDRPPVAHPLEATHGSGCLCCSGGSGEHT
jgi:putative FmdB family regulatory protein